MKQKKFGKEHYDNLLKVIKSIITTGEVFDNKKALYLKIGLDNLGLKNLNGGEQKKKAFERVSMCMRLESVEEGKQPVVCVEIYDNHCFVAKPDGRGKNGVYIDRTVPILIKELPYKATIYTTVKQLAKTMGMFKNVSYDSCQDELLEIDEKITRAMYNQFESRLKTIIDSVVFNTLNRLQNDYSFLKYKKKYNITLSNHKSKKSSLKETKIIEEAEKYVLSEYGYHKKFMITVKGLENEFYKKVVELINKTYGYNWIRYRRVIEIKLNLEELQKEKAKLIDFDIDIEDMKYEVREHLSEMIFAKTERDFINANHDADRKTEEWIADENNKIEDIVPNKQLVEWYALGICDREYLLRMYAPDVFRYNNNYLDVQSKIISYFIGSCESETVEENIEWLKFLDEAV